MPSKFNNLLERDIVLSKLKDQILGEEHINRQGAKFKIIGYDGIEHLTIEFEDGLIMSPVCYKTIKLYNGPAHPMYPSVYGIGFLGIGKHKSICEDNPQKTCKKYETWRGLFKRCYDEKSLAKSPTYRECDVCNEWHNYQVFGDWYDENYYEVPNEKMELEKDILVKGNKLYSPETCIFVPKTINNLFIRTNLRRRNLPTGVTKYKDKYMATVSNKKENNSQYIGTFDTPEKAFMAYKKAKEEIIKEYAEIYKQYIPKKLYDILISYEIDINY